jgi:hypothetical protein
MLAALTIALAALAVAGAGCGAAGGSGVAGAGGATVPGSSGTASPAPSGTASPAPSGTGTPGAGRTGAGGAAPVALDSLSCGGSSAGGSGTLPERDWTAVASCPLPTVHAGTNQPVPTPGAPVVRHGNLAPLVAALHQPDAPRSSGMCPDYRVLLPEFWLVDSAGEAYQPHVPVGPCGQPSDAVLAALRALGLT